MDTSEEGKISEAEKEKLVEKPKRIKAVPANKPVEKPAEISVPEKKETARRSGCGGLAIFISIIALLLGGGGLAMGILAYESASKPLTILSSGTDGNSANFVEGSIADVANSVSESVVSIVTSVRSTNFFGQSYSSAAAGTGIIVTSDGYILTNKHVINGATSVKVVLADGTTYENVSIAATDPLNDVAFLKVPNVSDLKVAKLGDSKTINVGQQVIVIGNALGQYQNSVTSGIISGIGRSLTATDESGSMSERLTDMIQTDAAINSGNSGGPVVNAAGEVIRMSTASSGSGENVGFAIPISSIKGMLSQLVETGSAGRAYVGVYSLDVTPAVAKQYGLPVSYGTYLYSSSNYTSIVSGSPAEKAGLKDKDIITAVNGAKIGEAGSLSSLVGEYKPGDVVSLTVYRDGKEIGVKVELAAYSEVK